MDTIARDGIAYRTEYVGERQTIRLERDGQRLGTVQSTRTGAWVPAKRDGKGPDDLPPMSAGRFTNPQDRLRWRYPEERIVIDETDGSVRALPVALVPSPCNSAIQEDEVLIITE